MVTLGCLRHLSLPNQRLTIYQIALIGVILGKIINSFPPPQHELRDLLYRLMGVAVAYFAVTWGWAVCWAVIGERVSRKTREKLLYRALGMDMAYFGMCEHRMKLVADQC